MARGNVGDDRGRKDDDEKDEKDVTVSDDALELLDEDEDEDGMTSQSDSDDDNKWE